MHGDDGDREQPVGEGGEQVGVVAVEAVTGAPAAIGVVEEREARSVVFLVGCHHQTER
jgi:hypothetical protein